MAGAKESTQAEGTGSEDEFGELKNLKSKKSTSSWGGRRKPPRAYTVTYLNNVEKGSAIIFVTGKGDTAVGSKTAKFSIRAGSMGEFLQR
ncbi:MAG: hypothetical protein IJT16_06035 [Lachnospiraceae bacterium]|nr:hypothetical protein [Lachnospiraceae bacterium]